MSISPISMGYSGYNGYSGYSVVSVNGNPGSLSRIEAIGANDRRKTPLVSVKMNSRDDENEEEKMLPKKVSLSAGGFADIFSMTQNMWENNFDDIADNSFLKDTMNSMMVGVRNSLY